MTSHIAGGGSEGDGVGGGGEGSGEGGDEGGEGGKGGGEGGEGGEGGDGGDGGVRLVTEKLRKEHVLVAAVPVFWYSAMRSEASLEYVNVLMWSQPVDGSVSESDGFQYAENPSDASRSSLNHVYWVPSLCVQLIWFVLKSPEPASTRLLPQSVGRKKVYTAPLQASHSLSPNPTAGIDPSGPAYGARPHCCL